MASSIVDKIAARLKDLRIEKGYTQSMLCFRTGVDRTFIGHIENGRKNVSIETLDRLIDGLGCDFQEFFSSPEFSKDGITYLMQAYSKGEATTMRPADEYTNRTRQQIIDELENKEV